MIDHADGSYTQQPGITISRHEQKVAAAKWEMVWKLNLLWLIIVAGTVYSCISINSEVVETYKEKIDAAKLYAYDQGLRVGEDAAHNEMYKQLPEYILWLESNGGK